MAPGQTDEPLGRTAWPSGVLECLGAMRGRLEDAGIQWFTPWWWREIGAFYQSGKRQFTARVGRRGRKSYSWCIVGVAEILTGRHAIPPGDTGVVAVVSADLVQANDRLATFVAVLEACGLRDKLDYKKTARGIEFTDRPYRVQTLAASVSAVSSYTCVMAIGDEVAKWRDGDGETSVGAQVLASWRSTMRTMPDAKMVLLSSPVGEDDPHAASFALGDTPRQTVAYAPTWVANPSLTEGWCRSDCETEEEFLQECAAIPQATAKGGITPAQIERATRRGAPVMGRFEPLTYVAAMRIDEENTWTLAITTKRTCPDGRVRISLVLSRQWYSPEDPVATMRDIARVCALYGRRTAYIDDAAPDVIYRIAQRCDVSLIPHPVKRTSQASLALRFAEDAIEIPEEPLLRLQLLSRTGRAVPFAIAAENTTAGPKDPGVRPDPWTEEWWDRQEREAVQRRRRLELAEERHDAGWVQRLAKEAGYG